MTKDKAIGILTTLQDGSGGTYEAIRMAIEALEADRPRGEWLKVIDHDGILMEHYVCDKCGMLTTDCSNFCPNCGAKMDGERSEE